VNLAHPISSVVPGVAGSVLSILGTTDTPLTGRRVAELAGDRCSRSGVNRSLRQLVLSGIVRCEHAGRSNLYSLNRHHIAASAIDLLVQLRETLLTRIATEVAAWPVMPAALWMFGSAARATGTEASDIDLLLVRPEEVEEDDETWNSGVLGLRIAVREWTGNTCQILDYGEVEFAALVDADDPLVGSLRREAVAIAGDTPRERIVRRTK
jgi:hypothetical protein